MKIATSGGSMLASLLTGVVSRGGGARPARDLTESEFAGTWLVEDSDGTPFEIELSASGIAEANRDGEGMSGTWDEVVGTPPSAAIAWDTGWITRITRTGDGYVKTAYDQTASTPTSTSRAERVG
ncbi:MAG: hypothetical protein AB7S70_04310 [Hyphomicrobium sp.]|uniref:hypothetical protein n=1 Tax=Hyphomicrobium sp. TaxID=82 RepID=UPI003D106F40